MANLIFRKPAIKGIVTTVGDSILTLEDQKQQFDFSDDDIAKLKKNLGIVSKYVLSDLRFTASDLCAQSARQLLEKLDVKPEEIDAVIFVTQTPDYRAPSTAPNIASRLGCPPTTMAFDISLGCSGFVYGLSIAFGLVEGNLSKVLLLVGDAASHYINPGDKTFAPLMGDAGSAILIDDSSKTPSHFCLYSDGTGSKSLYIPGSGTRQKESSDPDAGFMHMNGAEVFNFTIKVVPKMFDEIFAWAKTDKDSVDYYVLHQPNKYILNNIKKRLGLPDSKIPSETQSIYGNQNSASIPGTINGFLSNQFQENQIKSVIFAGFGIGLSWGASHMFIENIYAPAPLLFKIEEN